MKVWGLDNRQYVLHLSQSNQLSQNKSEGHKLARIMLKEIYAFEQIIEEVFLPGCEFRLHSDFFLPRRKTMLEIQGIQHRQFVPHFHGNIAGFLKQKKRDNIKKEWCERNNITLLELHDDRREQWREIIVSLRQI